MNLKYFRENQTRKLSLGRNADIPLLPQIKLKRGFFSMKKIQKMMNAWWTQFVKQAQMEAEIYAI